MNKEKVAREKYRKKLTLNFKRIIDYSWNLEKANKENNKKKNNKRE